MMRWLASAPSSAVCPSAPASLLPLASLTHHTHTCPLPLPLSPSFHSPLTCGEIICLVSRPSGDATPAASQRPRPTAAAAAGRARATTLATADPSFPHLRLRPSPTSRYVLIALQTTNHGERQPRAGSRGYENLCYHLTFCRTELERCGRAAQAAKPTYRSRSFICRRTGKRRQRTKFGRLRRAITVVVGDDSRRRRR